MRQCTVGPIYRRYDRDGELLVNRVANSDNSGGVSLAGTAVPEPATWGLMVLGFLSMAVALRTKRESKAVMA